MAVLTPMSRAMDRGRFFANPQTEHGGYPDRLARRYKIAFPVVPTDIVSLRA